MTLNRRALLAGLCALPTVALIPAAAASARRPCLKPNALPRFMGELRPGETFTIKGVHAVDPATGLASPTLQAFTVAVQPSLSEKWFGDKMKRLAGEA